MKDSAAITALCGFGTRSVATPQAVDRHESCATLGGHGGFRFGTGSVGRGGSLAAASSITYS